MPSTDRLDHTVINVKVDMDAAKALFGKLGFTLTPRGYHSHGSMNHLMMFGTDYLELIDIPEGKEIERKDLEDAPLGINGVVFKALDVDAIYARLQNARFDGDPPKAFHRPVDIDDGQRDAKFRTVTVRDGVFPGGRVYYCEHGTPELVWRPEWQSHANGVTSMPEFVAVAIDADGLEDTFLALRSQQFVIDRELQLQAHRDLIKADIVWNTELGLKQTTSELAAAERARAALYRRFATLFADYDLLVTPGANTPAFDVNLRHPERIDGVPLTHYLGASLLTAAVTLSAAPALSLPCGFDRHGRPVGLQLVGRPRGEAALLAAGAMYERESGLAGLLPIDPRDGTVPPTEA